MFFDFKVPVPLDKGKITKKCIRNLYYIYYIKSRTYSHEKKKTYVSSVMIGKRCEDDVNMMFPNENYFSVYPDADINEEKADQSRSSCLRVGSYIVIRKIIQDYGLDVMADKYIGDDAGLFLDLAAYSIVCEDNAGQYYPDYAYAHPLFTNDMRVYSDSKVRNCHKLIIPIARSNNVIPITE